MAKPLPDFKTAPDITYFLKLTNENGIIQHSHFSSPNITYGYSLDDNARALIVSCLFLKLFPEKGEFENLTTCFLNFLQNQQTPQGEFHNYLYVFQNQRFLSHELAEDSFGQVVWALGFLIRENINQTVAVKAKKILKKTLPNIENKTSLRTIAYCLAGLCHLFQAEKNAQVKKQAFLLVAKLKNAYNNNKSPDWLWFEQTMTYGNAILPWSLFLSSIVFKNKENLEIAKQSLKFLLKVTTKDNLPVPVGQRGWFPKEGKKADFDQQPIEASYMVFACMAAYKATGKKKYLNQAINWFGWFWGNNLLGKSLIDKDDGGCYDGLEPQKLNLNKGAESTVCYLLAFLELTRFFKNK